MPNSDRLLWINADSTVFVERWPNTQSERVGRDSVYVATRPDSNAVWGPPIECKPDSDTQAFLDAAREIH